MKLLISLTLYLNLQFCEIHRNEATPVVIAKKLSNENRDRLAAARENHSKSAQRLPKDQMFIVESILSSRTVRGKKQYKVKWAGFEQSAATWEPDTNIPPFIQEYYFDESRYGKTLPTPRIKHTKMAGKGEKYHLLQWDNGDCTEEEWLKSSLFEIDGDSMVPILSTCNTKKTKDKRLKHHSAGILISVRPCGIIPHFDEIFGCESISQIYASKMEFLHCLPAEVRTNIKAWFYDDMCHEKPFAENHKQANHSKVTKFYADSVEKAVDFFHFPGHRDAWCHMNTNPWELKKKMQFSKVNTPAAEQAFNWINRYKSVKGMNESRFIFFFRYLLDLHNWKIEGQVKTVVNPKCSTRSLLIKDIKNRLSALGLKHLQSDDASDDPCSLMETFQQLSLHQKTEARSRYKMNDLERCPICSRPFKRVGDLKNHMKALHSIKETEMFYECVCGSFFQDKKQLTRHMKLSNNKLCSN